MFTSEERVRSLVIEIFNFNDPVYCEFASALANVDVYVSIGDLVEFFINEPMTGMVIGEIVRETEYELAVRVIGTNEVEYIMPSEIYKVTQAR